jgi:hypothetical protein
MPTQSPKHHAATGDLHPRVYGAMVGLAVWLVLSVWLLFGSAGYTGLTFAIMTLFFAIALGLPALLWLTWRHHGGDAERGAADETFRDWAAHDFSTWTGGLSGREAATQILLPIMAVAIGMTVFGLVYVLAVPAS